jgi:enoyl-[acyl-carrier protein] reductase II
MRLQRNRVVREYNHRLTEVPQQRDHLEVVGKTVLNGQPMELHKFNVILPTRETEADWEEMPWLMGQRVGLINDIVPAGVVVERMMSEAKRVLDRLARAQG